MKKLTAADPESRTQDLAGENLERLKALFPEAFAEGRIDFEVLRQLLGDAIDEREEKYGLNWHGKRRARQLALTPSTGTLRPCPEESVDWDSTQNLMIEGDNLEVLKLLQKSYTRKVKMIYIDPPYNTGKEFIYPDRYQDNLDTYLRYTGQLGGEGLKISSNSETHGRYHTNWLNMMLPRLKLARNLLRDDGVIFVSIDDHEVHNLRHLMDEVFGPENFVANLVWKHTEQGKHDEIYFARHHNQILVYRRGDGLGRIRRARTEEDNRNYSNPDNDPRGPWRSGDVRSPNPRPTLRYAVPTPSGGTILPPDNGWRWSEATLQAKISEGEIVFSSDESRIIRKIYLNAQEGRVPENIIEGKQHGDTRTATRELRERIGDDNPFDTPKPTGLISYLASLVTSKTDLVLDFFAGSGATGDAVMQLNVEDGGNRRFILVQLPEKADAPDYATIAEITKARLRAAATSIAEGPGINLPGMDRAAAVDLGFRVFKLASSNIRAWEPDRENLAQTLLDSLEHLHGDRTETDILYELLLKLGLELCVPIDTRTIGGKEVHAVGGGVLMACLAPEITRDEVEPLALGLVEWHEALAPAGDTTCVFRDSAFADDVAKTNLAAILDQHGIGAVRSL